MKDRIGEEYDGIISGVTERGIFVELSNTVEGMIKRENLKGDYKLDEIKYCLSSPSHSFTVGDRIRVKTQNVSEDKVEFILADN